MATQRTIDRFLILVLMTSFALGHLLTPLVDKFATLGLLALVILLIRRLLFLPHWILTGREY